MCSNMSGQCDVLGEYLGGHLRYLLSVLFDIVYVSSGMHERYIQYILYVLISMW